jgi:ABC-type antimicrobial peptide transport system permease subunit
VSQRTGEIGIRMALGATREQVRWMILREGMLLVLGGLALGLGGALLLSRSISGLLFRVSALDPLTLAGVSLILLVVAAAACLVPAARATAIEPMVALRNS